MTIAKQTGKRIVVAGLFGCAALQFVRFYIKNTVPYLDMPAYLAGRERMPFQARVLPIPLLRLLQHFLRHSPQTSRVPEYLLSLAAFSIACVFTQKLYRRLTSSGTLQALVFPVFLYTSIWTYVLHSEANFFYPYDLPALAFFAAGLYFVYTRQFWKLFFVILVGTFNRETTVFLIVLYGIDAATSSEPNRGLDLSRVPWIRLSVLAFTWLAIKLWLAHHFRANDTSESFLRITDNLHQLRPRLLPALLNICGYSLPIVLLFANQLHPRRFRNYLWIAPVWFLVMFSSGVLVETRIYGELCPLASVAAILIFENVARSESRTAPS